MNLIRLFLFLTLPCVLVSCAPYTTPVRSTWTTYLQGVSFTDMTSESKIAKKPVYLGAGGKLVNSEQVITNNYGKEPDENQVVLQYMENLENELYDSLRKPGISVQRAGTDIVVVLVRDALMQLDTPAFSDTGIDTLGIISKILQKYDATFLEIAGYTDSFKDKMAARALSLDMAERTAIFFTQHKINNARMFVVGRGSARPIAAQDDIGRLTNRRVEIRISPAR
jgi:outer membrane protein OmpA-like peptidoglycan-associated protein